MLQATGPNGIATCYAIDAAGNQFSQTAQCNSPSSSFTSSTQRFRTTGHDPAGTAVVAVRQEASGVEHFVYSDVLGREIGTLSREFNGSFLRTITDYNHVGQINDKSKPFAQGSSAQFFTTFQYDGLSRTIDILDQEGVINPLVGSPDSLHTTITFSGPSITTGVGVRGVMQTRTETKNALGKVVAVQDNAGATTHFAFNADGNLIAVQSPLVNNLSNITAYSYDARGRKYIVNDPDIGNWVYTFDAFGDVTQMVDDGGARILKSYDALGRLTSKTDPGGDISQWFYDVGSGAGVGKIAAMIGAPDSRLNGPCAAPSYVTSSTDGNRAIRTWSYTQFGQIEEVQDCIDGETFLTDYQYDGLNRQSVVTYPQADGSRLSIGYHYTAPGNLQYVDDATTGQVYWAAKQMNELGQVTDEYTANGVETFKNRNDSTGWLMESTSIAHADNETTIQDVTYGYDEVGDLALRFRSNGADQTFADETFTYDSLNRLSTANTTAEVGYTRSESYFYDSLGNITNKNGLGYTYAGGCGVGNRNPGPHTLCSTSDGALFNYDGHGNMTSGGSRLLTFNSDDKVIHVENDPKVSLGNDTGAADFIYGADQNRVVQIATSPSSQDPSRTVYVGLGGDGKSLYERTTTGSTVQHVHYIYAADVHGGSPFALRVVTDEPGASSTATKYNHFDHLGSVTATSDEVGHVITPEWGGADATEFDYDPWGARRNPDSTFADVATFDLPVGHRGFTGQETIPNVELVNMNGRLYDPALGRFLSPDPNIQSESDLQSYNRYSYVQNNPLRYTDPTGYFLDSVSSVLDFSIMFFAIVTCPYTGGAGCAVAATMFGTVLGASAALQAGDPASVIAANAIIGGASGLVGMGVGGEIGPNLAGALIGGAVGGGVDAALSDVVRNKGLGYNVLEAAAEGAALGAAGFGAKQFGSISEASAGQTVGQDASPQPRSSQIPVSTSRLVVVNDGGQITGYIDYTYTPRSDGAGVVLNLWYTSVNGDGSLNWVQSVTTNNLHDQWGAFQFNDNGNGGGTGYFTSPGTAESIAQKSDYDAHMTDSPGRVDRSTYTPAPNISWSAEASLVSTSNSQIFITVTYGFSTNAAGQLTMLPLSVSEPTPFQLDRISSARAMSPPTQ
jgi:RHS repeat-associated protein